uniref:Transposase n=1 Tax=Steinernema glaseri TaxID=37863 RepID=A0A1I8ALU4_9BILA
MGAQTWSDAEQQLSFALVFRLTRKTTKTTWRSAEQSTRSDYTEVQRRINTKSGNKRLLKTRRRTHYFLRALMWIRQIAGRLTPQAAKAIMDEKRSVESSLPEELRSGKLCAVALSGQVGGLRRTQKSTLNS